MKQFPTVLSIFILFFAAPLLRAQEPIPDTRSGWQFSVRGGYDFPTYNNETPYIDYNGGLELGASVDYYWNWFGIGGDFDYIQNSPENTYPTNNLVYQGNPITSFMSSSDGIKRTFYGIGPSFKYQKNDKFSAELKIRAGLATLTGGRTSLTGFWEGPGTMDDNFADLNFHGGYSQKMFFSMKGSLQLNYFFTQRFGVHIGAYYMEHFKVKEDSINGRSSAYRNYETTVEDNQITHTIANEQNIRTEPCDCEVHSIGIFAGITYRIPRKRDDKPETKKNKFYSLTVTAKDKFNLLSLPKTEVTVSNAKGEVVLKGITDEKGEIVFDSITPDNYVIDGLLYEKKLDPDTTLTGEYKPNQSLQKVIYYSDLNFIVQGTVIDSQTKKPIPTVSIKSGDKQIVTDENGKFRISMLTTGAAFYLKKDKYFSKTEEISTDDVSREKTLFINVDIPMEKFDCNKAITLKNIHYDLDKFFIRDDAKPELDKLVTFMKDNPDITVELSSHTDCRASHKYNNTLSQNRANAAVDYLVSQGIDRSRLIGKGYGETKLLNRCADNVPCSEDEHQLNRRTEMKVICPQ